MVLNSFAYGGKDTQVLTLWSHKCCKHGHVLTAFNAAFCWCGLRILLLILPRCQFVLAQGL